MKATATPEDSRHATTLRDAQVDEFHAESIEEVIDGMQDSQFFDPDYDKPTAHYIRPGEYVVPSPGNFVQYRVIFDRPDTAFWAERITSLMDADTGAREMVEILRQNECPPAHIPFVLEHFGHAMPQPGRKRAPKKAFRRAQA
jgi:hypothetical protein